MAGRNQRRFLVLNRFTNWFQRMRSLNGLATRWTGPAFFFLPLAPNARLIAPGYRSTSPELCFLEMPPKLPTYRALRAATKLAMTTEHAESQIVPAMHNQNFQKTVPIRID
jgi:hypothetical protein